MPRTCMRSKRFVYSSTAASPRRFTSARIFSTVFTTAASETLSHASRCSRRGQKSVAVQEKQKKPNNPTTTPKTNHTKHTHPAKNHRRRHAADEGVDARVLHLHRGLVDDELRAHVGDVLERREPVRLERVAGVDQIDDEIGEPDDRRELHRTV